MNSNNDGACHAFGLAPNGPSWPRRYLYSVKRYRSSIGTFSLALHNICMKLHIYDQLIHSDSVLWTVARNLVIAVPPLVGVFALISMFR